MLAAAELFAIKSPVDMSCFVCSSISSGEWISNILYSGGTEFTSIMYLKVQGRHTSGILAAVERAHLSNTSPCSAASASKVACK
jgi:hypothetical protein